MRIEHSWEGERQHAAQRESSNLWAAVMRIRGREQDAIENLERAYLNKPRRADNGVRTKGEQIVRGIRCAGPGAERPGHYDGRPTGYSKLGKLHVDEGDCTICGAPIVNGECALLCYRTRQLRRCRKCDCVLRVTNPTSICAPCEMTIARWRLNAKASA